MKTINRLASFIKADHRYVYLGTSVIAALGLAFSQRNPTPLSFLAPTGVFQDCLWAILCHPHQMRIFFEGTVRIGVTCCNKLNRGCEAVTDSLRREGKNEGIVRQAGHRIIKHIHEK